MPEHVHDGGKIRTCCEACLLRRSFSFYAIHLRSRVVPPFTFQKYEGRRVKAPRSVPETNTQQEEGSELLGDIDVILGRNF